MHTGETKYLGVCRYWKSVFLKRGGDETKYKYERGVYKIGTRGNRQHMDIATYRMNQPSGQFSENQKS